MPHFEKLDDLVVHLRETGMTLWAGMPKEKAIPIDRRGNAPTLFKAIVSDYKLDQKTTGGLFYETSDVTVSDALVEKMQETIEDEQSDLRSLSSRPVKRGFVFVDLSDFSRMGSGVQQLVVMSLVKLVEIAEWKRWGGRLQDHLYAKLCIGDGYVYVLDGGFTAAYLGAYLAKLIESRVAEATIPEFHFRMGVHVGDVRRFWDPGRKDWNYVGDGINGGSRVLSAIGKEVDDVVFISGETRQEIMQYEAPKGKAQRQAASRVEGLRSVLLSNLENKGRRADKHGELWRVYQLNHYSAITDDLRAAMASTAANP